MKRDATRKPIYSFNIQLNAYSILHRDGYRSNTGIEHHPIPSYLLPEAMPCHLQLHSQSLVHPQRLPYAEIQHDFLATTRNSISSDVSV